MLDKVGSRAPGAKQQRSTSHIDASPWQVLQRLVRERWREYAGRYAAALLLMAIASGATAFSAWIMKDIVNDIFVRRDQSPTGLQPFCELNAYTSSTAALWWNLARTKTS